MRHPLPIHLNEETLAADDWRALGRYAVALQLRTPAAYMTMLERWAKDFPPMLDKVTRESVRMAARAVRRGALMTSSGVDEARFPVTTRITEDPTTGKAALHADVDSQAICIAWPQVHL